jgi:hypothetical protein
MLHSSLSRLSGCCSVGRGVTYEVSVAFDSAGETQEKFINWLTSHHIKAVLAVDGFLSAELQNNASVPGVVVRYQIESMDAYERYDKSDLARRLRQEAIDVFGSSLPVSRRLLVSLGLFYK